MKMNKAQFDIIAAKLIESKVQREAVKLFMFNDAISAYAVEMQFYNKAVGLVSRNANRINAYFADHIELMAAGNE